MYSWLNFGYFVQLQISSKINFIKNLYHYVAQYFNLKHVCNVSVKTSLIHGMTSLNLTVKLVTEKPSGCG